MKNLPLLKTKISDYIYFTYNIYGRLTPNHKYYINELYCINNYKNYLNNNNLNLATIRKYEVINTMFDYSFKNIIDYIHEHKTFLIKIDAVHERRKSSFILDIYYLIKNDIQCYDKILQSDSFINAIYNNIKFYCTYSENSSSIYNTNFIQSFLYSKEYINQIISLPYKKLEDTDINCYVQYNYQFGLQYKLITSLLELNNQNHIDLRFLEKYILIENRYLYNIFDLYLNLNSLFKNTSENTDVNINLDILYNHLLTKYDLRTVNILIWNYIQHKNTTLQYQPQDKTSYIYWYFTLILKVEHYDITSLLLIDCIENLDTTEIYNEIYNYKDFDTFTEEQILIILNSLSKFNNKQQLKLYLDKFSKEKLISFLDIYLSYKIANYKISPYDRIHTKEIITFIFEYVGENLLSFNKESLLKMMYNLKEYETYDIYLSYFIKKYNMIEKILQLNNIPLLSYLINLDYSRLFYIIINNINYEYEINLSCDINAVILLYNKSSKFILYHNLSSTNDISKFNQILFEKIICSLENNQTIEIFKKRRENLKLTEHESNLFNNECYTLIKKYKILPNI
jgi:hypothetical protein